VESKTTLKAKSRANLMRSFFAVNPVAAIRVNGGSTQYVDHVVVATDTLQGIALRYGVTVQEIKRYHFLSTNY
jgi:LysM repeat protein